MISELPKLFGKNFAIGFFLPAAAIALGVLGLAALHHHATELLAQAEGDPLKLGTISIVALWLFAVAMMAVHRSTAQLLEGYGRLNPFQIISDFELEKFNRLQKDLEDRVTAAAEARKVEQDAAARAESARETADEAARALREAVEEIAAGPDPAALSATIALEIVKQETAAAAWAATQEYDGAKSQAAARRWERSHARSALVDRFPHEPGLVLPTRFGNTLRAFEVYSNVVYGLDAVPAWPRLAAIIPSKLGDQIEEAQANVSFWLNLWLGGLILAAIEVGWAWLGDIPCWRGAWAVALGASYLFAKCASATAQEWGEYVKSAFDLHRHDLATQLGLAYERSIEDERDMWRTVSRMMIYRDADAAKALDKYRQKDEAPTPAGGGKKVPKAEE
jgi:hypothetical protein